MFDALENYIRKCDTAIKLRQSKVSKAGDYDNYSNDLRNVRKKIEIYIFRYALY